MKANRFVFNKVNPTPNTVRPLADFLKEQEMILDKLVRVIDSEFKALKERDMAQLNALSMQKSDLMVKLQSNDQRIKLHPDVATLKTDFADEVGRIKAKMNQCKFRNETNGRLITMCMQSVNKLQALFVGVRDSLTRNMTYSSKGTASARGPVRLSVVA